MKADTFFQFFDLLAKAPNSVAKLRELILQLAIQGKLGTRDTSDEPAPKLLARIRESVGSPAKKGRNQSSRVTEFEETDAPFPIPSNWSWCRIGDVASDIGNCTPKERFTYIDVGAIDKKHGRIGPECEVLEPSNAPSRARKKVALGSVIYSTVRPYLLNVAVVDKAFSPAPIVSTAFAVIHPHLDVSSRYIFYVLRTPHFINYVESQMAGIAYPAITDSKVFEGLIPLPPLAEQRRIVSKVDELLRLCDELETRNGARRELRERLVQAALDQLLASRDPADFAIHWQRLQTHFDMLFDTSEAVVQLKRTIMQLAIQGRLVRQDPRDERVHVSLASVTSGMPYSIPESWTWASWGELLTKDGGGFKRGPFGSSLRKADFVSSGYKVYEQYCPINDDCSFARYFITEEKYLSMKSFAVQAGDFLISCSGVTLGRITQVPAQFEPGIINQALLRVRIGDHLLAPEYFKLLFRSPYFQRKIFENSTGSAIPNVKGVKELKAIHIPVPPLAEQKRIVSKVTELLSRCDALEAKLTQAESASTQLLSVTIRDRLVAELIPGKPCLSSLETKRSKARSSVP